MLGRWCRNRASTKLAFLNGHRAGGHKYPSEKQSTPQPAAPMWAAAPASMGIYTELAPGLCGDVCLVSLQASTEPGPL